MTTLTSSPGFQATPAFLSRVSHGISALIDGVFEARDMAERFKTLSRMTDTELAKHGITREQIPQAVFDARRAA